MIWGFNLGCAVPGLGSSSGVDLAHSGAATPACHLAGDSGTTIGSGGRRSVPIAEL